jgi:energy-coupling factor transporter ATP-binding protein EcfA2
MTDARLLFLGRTGVGKSSLINFLAGEERCNTDPYRACTKEPTIIDVRYDEYEYELIDTPGLCEGSSELDSLYLGLIDRYLVDDKVSPNLVFKSDDTRLRSEDYQLINTLLRRYGNRIFSNSALMLTFAGNLQKDFHSKIHKRVKGITTAIYGIQTSLGMDIFDGFPRITLVDSELKSFFDIEVPRNKITMQSLIGAMEHNQHEEVAQRLGVHPELSESIIESIARAQGGDSVATDKMLGAINQFPFHNIIQETTSGDQSTNLKRSKMIEEPKSVYELAQMLSSEGHNERLINIDSGLLTFKRVVPYRKLVNSGRYADCISVLAYAERTPAGHLTYQINYKISGHQYLDSGDADVDAIFKSSDEAANTIVFQTTKWIDFKRMVGFPDYIVNTGLIAFRASVEEALANEEVWGDS